jgi:ABC-type branched-subunit amino acid transport system ATPase component
VTAYKVLAFALSAFFTGAIGGIHAYWATFIEPASVFDVGLNVKMIVATLFGGIGLLAGPVAGAVVLEFVDNQLWTHFLKFHQLIFASLLVIAILAFPTGIWPYYRRVRDYTLKHVSAPGRRAIVVTMGTALAPGELVHGSPPVQRQARGRPKETSLDVQGASKHFGGLKAVDNVSFRVGCGEIVALIGPNGAGKTTLLNVISGLLRPDAGAVSFDGRPLQVLEPHQIARLGVARTFQIVHDFRDMTVRDSVKLGALFVPARGCSVDESVERALSLLNLTDQSDAIAAILPLALRRRVGLAKAIAMAPRLLLLDEVMAGLNQTETAHLMETIRGINATGITVLLVEHIMRAVMGLADHIVVLDRGKLLAEGCPSAISQDQRVIVAYLGSKYGGKAQKVTQC